MALLPWRCSFWRTVEATSASELPNNQGAVKRLYCGENLDVLRRSIDNESADLVFLTPPLNSNTGFNVLSAEWDSTWAASQTRAFEDT